VASDLDVGTAHPFQATSNGLDARDVASANINGSDLALVPNTVYGGPKQHECKIIGTSPVGSIQDTVLKKWLKDHGVDLSKVKMIPLDPGDAAIAMSTGKVDGAFLPHP
jgi:NitT/TauT family transport system substrate-binding protein